MKFDPKTLFNTKQLRNFVLLIQDTNKFIQAHLNQKNAFREVLLYFIYVNVLFGFITCIIWTRIQGIEFLAFIKSGGPFFIITFSFSLFIYISLLAGIIRFSWRVVRGIANYEKTLIATIYVVGTALVFNGILLLAVIGAVSTQSSVGHVALLLFSLFVIWWTLRSWKAFRTINHGTVWRSLAALAMTVVAHVFLLAPALWNVSDLFVRFS